MRILVMKNDSSFYAQKDQTYRIDLLINEKIKL